MSLEGDEDAPWLHQQEQANDTARNKLTKETKANWSQIDLKELEHNIAKLQEEPWKANAHQQNWFFAGLFWRFQFTCEP